MDFDNLLLGSRLCIHMATAASIAFYVGNPNRPKYVIQMLAALLAGSSGALAFQIITTWDELRTAGPQPWSLVFFGSFLGLVIYAGGNIAKVAEILAAYNPLRFWR